MLVRATKSPCIMLRSGFILILYSSIKVCRGINLIVDYFLDFSYSLFSSDVYLFLWPFYAYDCVQSVPRSLYIILSSVLY